MTKTVVAVVTNNTTVISDIDTIAILYDYMKVYVDGAHFTTAYERGWDGYKRLCSKRGKFATGYLPMVINCLAESKIHIQIDDKRTGVLVEPSQVIIELKYGELLRTYQERAVEKAVYNTLNRAYFPRGIIDAATNAGKNYIMASIILSYEIPKTVLLIHNREIFDQLVEFMARATGDENIGWVTSSKVGIKIGQITIAMYKTLLSRYKKGNAEVIECVNNTELLLCDETHRAGSKDYSSTIYLFKNAYARFFVSGTPLQRGNKSSNLPVTGMSGQKLYRVTNRELIDMKVSLEPIIRMYKSFDYSESYLTGDEDFSIVYNECIVNSETRLKHILEYTAANPTYKILIAVKLLEHGHNLSAVLKAPFLHGGSEFRSELYDDFKKAKSGILISTILREGINIPDIDALILAQGGKSVIEIKQLIGRLVRDDGIHKTVDVIDWIDSGEYVYSHSKKRMKLYDKEKFVIKIVE